MPAEPLRRRSLRTRLDYFYWNLYVHTWLRRGKHRPHHAMTSVYRRNQGNDASSAIRYTPCAKSEQTDDSELEEIAVVSRDTLSVTDDPEPATANGPRHPSHSPTLYQNPSDRTKLIGERLCAAGALTVSSPVYTGKVVEQQKPRSTSKASLLEIVSQKLDRVRSRKPSSLHSKEEVAFINKAAYLNDVMTPREARKQRRKDIQEKFGKQPRRGTKHQIDRLETLTSLTTSSVDRDGCNWTFVFDPAGRLAYWWSLVVSLAFLYNFWVIIYRFAFEEINAANMVLWFPLDYLADLLYVLDIAFHFRTAYLEDGVLQTDGTKLRIHYMNSTMFYIDCLCLLPLDFLYLSIGFKSMLRCFRLVKIYRFWTFLDRTERHTNYPNVVRTVTLLHYLLAIYHWNACLIYLVTKNFDNVDDSWLYRQSNTDVLTIYLHSLYWSTLTLTTIGDLPRPKAKGEYIFVIVEFVLGLLLFATILGHVANIVTNISTARKDFQAKLDSVKTYMSLRRVPIHLQDRVIKWFDYLWLSKKSWDEEKALALLPDKLKAEIALHVHLDTLKRVEIFQNTEAGFLCELVLKLRPVLFSPGDYICRKGEVGKEMYIVNRGRLQVVADNGKTVLATLRPGSYFGEISILNMGNEGNRRTASVRSVGYSDLFCLSKQDLWDVLKEYPAARVRLEAIAVKRLEKYKKAPLQKASQARRKSTPGLIESMGKVPLESMVLGRHHTLPAGLPGGPNAVGSACSLHMYRPSATSSRSGSPHSPATQPPTQSAEVTLAPSTETGLDNCQTVSSMTSFLTDVSMQRSPLPNASRHSPTSTPPHAFTFPLPSTSGRPPPLPSPAPDARLHAPPGASVSASQSLLALTAPSSQLPTSVSLGALSSRERPASDLLLREVERLRARLLQLETDNSCMGAKLNQQQNDVEARLAQIEMHVCGEAPPLLPGNKESFI